MLEKIDKLHTSRKRTTTTIIIIIIIKRACVVFEKVDIEPQEMIYSRDNAPFWGMKPSCDATHLERGTVTLLQTRHTESRADMSHRTG